MWVLLVLLLLLVLVLVTGVKQSQIIVLNPNQTEGEPNGPPGFKSLISREPKVGLTSNQAVNLSLSVV